MKSTIIGLIAMGITICTLADSDQPVVTDPTSRYWINTGTNYILYPNGTPEGIKCKPSLNAPCIILSNDPDIPASFPLDHRYLYSHLEVQATMNAMDLP